VLLRKSLKPAVRAADRLISVAPGKHGGDDRWCPALGPDHAGIPALIIAGLCLFADSGIQLSGMLTDRATPTSASKT